MSDQKPKVTVVIPCRNEKGYIESCLSSLIEQDYPRHLLELLVVDGMSDDGSREVIERMAQEHDLIQMLDNPRRVTPIALNIGIRKTSGQRIIILGAHSYVNRDFVRQNVEAMERTGADCTGGPITNVSHSFIAKAISLAMSSPFGVGNALFRYSQKESWVDTVAFGCYHKDVFDRIGYFDEELVRNQDDEFNFRLSKAGGKILLSPRIQSSYHTRGSMGKLWKQYFQYGFWKTRVIQKHGSVPALRHLIPMAFVLGLIGSGLLSLLFSLFIWVWMAIIASYLLGALLFSFKVTRKEGFRYFLILPVLFFILHFSYGLGFLQGIFYFYALRRSHVDEKYMETSR